MQSARAIKTLLVEDSPIIRADVAKLLTTLGLSVITAENGEDAWHYLQKVKLSNNETPEIIFSDVNMPTMNGIQLLEKIRNDQKYAELPFVILTSNKEELLRVTALCLNVTSFFLKPPDPSQIQRQLRKIFSPKNF